AALGTRYKVLDGKIKEIARADGLEPPELNDGGGEENGRGSEGEGAAEAIEEGLIALLLRQVPHHHGENEGVVGGKKGFQYDEDADCAEITGMESLSEEGHLVRRKT